MTPEAILLGLDLVSNLLFVAILFAMLRTLERERREHRAQVDRLLVLGRAETLDQFAAVEQRLQRERLEQARDLVHPEVGGIEGAEGDKVASKARGPFHGLFRRPPPPPADEPAKADEE